MVGAEAFRHGGCECRQPLPVFVEQAPCRGVFRMAFGSFACAAYLLPGQLPVAAAYPAGREGLVDDAPFERQAVYPAVGGHLVARGHQPAAGHEARPDARAERQRHYAFGVVRDPAEAFAQREGPPRR